MLYTIENLHCAYNKHRLVLSVPKLEIEPGQIVMVLGKSGYGKSTFLETLALMNNPIQNGTVVFSPPSGGGQMAYELQKVWQNGQRGLPEQIRSQHFSFIFQQTNLMPNFSVYENIYITKMIQGYREDECHAETMDILDRIGLGRIEMSRNVTELSGGQRQRVAFARAIISSFDVLFGDELTGNLDEMNAHELMLLLSDFIHQRTNPHPKTAIIVTHSIEMAVSYADTIVLISRKNGSGCIAPDSVYKRVPSGKGNEWTNDILTLTEASCRNYLKEQFFYNNHE